MLGKGIKAIKKVRPLDQRAKARPVPTKVPKIKAKPRKLVGGGMLGPHPQQGRVMKIAAPQGPRAKQAIPRAQPIDPVLPRGKVGKGPGMKAGGAVKSKGMRNGGAMKSKGMARGGAVNKRKATGAAKRGFGKAYMKGKR